VCFVTIYNCRNNDNNEVLMIFRIIMINNMYFCYLFNTMSIALARHSTLLKAPYTCR
jgi:hypothetical protein